MLIFNDAKNLSLGSNIHVTCLGYRHEILPSKNNPHHMTLLGVHASELSVAALPGHRVCMALNLTFLAVETLCPGKPATHQPARIGKVQSAKLIMQ